jgi:AraC family transcriptional activator of mtrCDE
MSSPPVSQPAKRDLDRLLSGLEVRFIQLAECVVSPGWQLALGTTDAPGIHYNLMGRGRVFVGDEPPIQIAPHTLLIVPPRKTFKIEAAGGAGKGGLVAPDVKKFAPRELQRWVAGQGAPEILLICGYFHASYGRAVELFGRLPAPIVEQFDAADQVDRNLRNAMEELVSQEVGSGAMSAAQLTQVLVSILRRSLRSSDLWLERFAMLSDSLVARAFAAMVARPGAPYSVESLARMCNLSRSAFMARFKKALGQSPMTLLRHLRMQRAAVLLEADSQSVEEVAAAVGFASRSSFLRAFRKAHGRDPVDLRAVHQTG